MRKRFIVIGIVAAVASGAYVAIRNASGPTPKQPALAPLASIKPTRRMKARISVPDLGKESHAVVAEIMVPDGYYMAMWGNEVTFRRSPSPEISLRSLATVEGSPGGAETPPVPFVGKTCDGVPQGRREPLVEAKDGWTIVCRGETDGEPVTLVVRDLNALGSELQCVVDFTSHTLSEHEAAAVARNVQQNMSSARVADALAICGSITLRTIREGEQHEQWNGHEWVKGAQ